MSIKRSDRPVVIVGGGPVGLFLAIALIKKGLSCIVLEKRKDPVPDSRSLGIHPVSVEFFDQLDLTQEFLEKGLKIHRGLAFGKGSKLGEITFSRCPKPHNYILACPQFTTEQILREHLNALNPEALVTEAEFSDQYHHEDHVVVQYAKDDIEHKIEGSYLVGCDGKNSRVRTSASIHFSGKRYPDTYVMGDFEDTTNFGSDAAVYLHPAGLVECFPLPNGMRRWVAKTDSYLKDPAPGDLVKLVEERTGYDLAEVEQQMLSSFGVQHFLAEFYVKDRVILAGDSAHVVSPIGGQGMNLGWIDAMVLAEELSESVPDLNRYQNEQKKLARKVAKRAEMNMILGRKWILPFIKELIVKIMLGTSFRHTLAKLFTMRGLKNWWI